MNLLVALYTHYFAPLPVSMLMDAYQPTMAKLC